MTFLSTLHRTSYDQFYANRVNIINADATKVPKSVNEVYQEAKAYVIIATGTKPNGTPVSFATTTMMMEFSLLLHVRTSAVFAT